MDDDARNGRKIILVIIAGLLVPNLVISFASGASIGTAIARVGISVVLSLLLWRGYSWARSYLAFSLGFAALLTVLAGLLALLAVSWLAVMLLVAPLYAWGAWALWSSPKVEAYIAHSEKQFNPDMSFNTGA